jgi:hypothetical protein
MSVSELPSLEITVPLPSDEIEALQARARRQGRSLRREPEIIVHEGLERDTRLLVAPEKPAAG